MAQAVKGVETMALHANENIQHKDQLTTFVPWQTISFSALLAEEFEESPYHQSTSSKLAAKLQATEQTFE